MEVSAGFADIGSAWDLRRVIRRAILRREGHADTLFGFDLGMGVACS